MSQNSAASTGAANLTKDELILHVHHLRDQALFAKSCDAMARLYTEYKDKYPMAIMESDYFYNNSFCAWTFSSSMTLAKLYDDNSKSESLQDLFTIIQRNKSLFPSREKYTIPYDPSPLSFQDCCKRFKNKMRALETVIKKLLDQRNTSLAHNDKEFFSALCLLYGEDGLTETEYQSLVDFAVNLTSFCLFVVTGQKPPEIELGISDWHKTIEIVEKHRDHTFDADLKEMGIL